MSQVRADSPSDFTSPSLGVSHDKYRIRLVAGTGNSDLAMKISEFLKIPLEEATIDRFADGEINIQIEHNIRGSDVFIIQPMSPPHVNDNFMELLLLIHTLRNSSARRVTAIVPYYGYARQDRKTKPRVPISASVVAQLVECMNPARVVSVDLHCGQIQGFFKNIPVENLFAQFELIAALQKYLTVDEISKNSLVVVSPDAGGVARANKIAERLDGNTVVTILKRRMVANQVATMEMVGDVTNKICVIVDDMIDTGGTLCKAAALLKSHGARRVLCIATHGLFSNDALDKIAASYLEKVFVTDTLPQFRAREKCEKLEIVTVSHLLGQAILNIHKEESLSELFDCPKKKEE
jgi:ribose-phosphate pyrophosphokinase